MDTWTGCVSKAMKLQCSLNFVVGRESTAKQSSSRSLPNL